MPDSIKTVQKSGQKTSTGFGIEIGTNIEQLRLNKIFDNENN